MRVIVFDIMPCMEPHRSRDSIGSQGFERRQFCTCTLHRVKGKGVKRLFICKNNKIYKFCFIQKKRSFFTYKRWPNFLYHPESDFPRKGQIPTGQLQHGNVAEERFTNGLGKMENSMVHGNRFIQTED
jgi:hypothetical protein